MQQTEMEVRALRIATRKRQYKGFHKFCKHIQDGLEEDARELREVICEYADAVPEVSATKAVACSFGLLSDVVDRLLAAAESLQAGWENISSEAQAASANAVDALADEYMEDLTDLIMELDRLKNAFLEAAGDRAYWKQLDKDLLKKYG